MQCSQCQNFWQCLGTFFWPWHINYTVHNHSNICKIPLYDSYSILAMQHSQHPNFWHFLSTFFGLSTLITLHAIIKTFVKYFCMIAIVFWQCSAHNAKISGIVLVPFSALAHLLHSVQSLKHLYNTSV